MIDAVAQSWPDLPVTAVLPALSDALSQGDAVLTAPPGSGKSTVAPLHLLDASWLRGRHIVMLEPRRLATRATAARMAQLRGEGVGNTVGYQVRFERRMGRQTRMEVMTEGLLTRRLQNDPELPGVGLVIFDEFHERSLQADLALALALDARETLQLDFRILVMSATLDADRVAHLLGDAPVISGQGQVVPVEVRYRSAAAASPAAAVAGAVRAALAEADGGVLAFLPGGREIRAAQRLLENVRAHVFPLYGDLPAVQQDAALHAPAGPHPKIVLATNLAQTSLTVEGVAAVVDSGQVRTAHYDLGAGANTLLTGWVSRASADQRAGRAGRLGPGIAYRLWSRERHAHLAAHDTPEMLVADLSRFALELAVWGVRDVAELRLLDAPPAAAWSAAHDLLWRLGAVDDGGRITARGKSMVRLPLEPRRAAMLLEAQDRGLAAEAVWVAALLDQRGGTATGDLERQLEQLRLDPQGVSRRVDETARQLAWLLQLRERRVDQLDATMVGRIVALAYPERIARRRPRARGVYLSADGREARLDPREDLAATEWLAIAHWQPGTTRRVRSGARIDAMLLLQDHPQAFCEFCDVRWDAQAKAVVAERISRFGAIELTRAPWPDAPAVVLQETLLDGLRTVGPTALPWTATARQWQARVQSLRLWRPDEAWPDVGDRHLMETLEDWLTPALTGVTRLTQLARIDLGTWLGGHLTTRQASQLERQAPTHLHAPSGSRLRLAYAADGSPPRLAVKLQELFGLMRTPTINDGRVAVVLELLSPAGRLVQTTRDLVSFWRMGYADVRRELRGRYPKHPWPEDPLTATPTARTKRRGRQDSGASREK